MSNLTFVDRRRSSSTVQATTPTTYKFPDLAADALQAHSDHPAVESRSPSPRPLPLHNNLHSHERWQARRDSRIGHNWGNGSAFAGGSGGARHGRQKSLSEAIRTVRDRKGSVTQNAQEIAEALKAPVSGKLIVRSRDESSLSSISVLVLILSPQSCSAASGTPHQSCPTRRPKPS